MYTKINKHTTTNEEIIGIKVTHESYDYKDQYEVRLILNKFYNIFKHDLTKPVRINLDILQSQLNNKYDWQRKTYFDIVLPLKGILEQLKEYI